MAEIDESQAHREANEVDRSKGDFKYEENYAFDAGVGLSAATVDYIAKVKGEEEWIREFRQKSLKIFQDMPMPTHWATTDLENIKFEDIIVALNDVGYAQRSRVELPGEFAIDRHTVVLISRGGDQAGKPLTVTDPNMTRFMMTLDDAVDLVLYAFEHGNPGEIFVQKAPAATIETLATALTGLLGVPDHPVNTIGTRHGEKLFEVLLSREEMVAAEDLGGYYRVPPDLRDLNYGKYVERGQIEISQSVEYNSHNTTRLDVPGMQEMLMKLRFMQAIARGELVLDEDALVNAIVDMHKK